MERAVFDLKSRARLSYPRIDTAGAYRTARLGISDDPPGYDVWRRPRDHVAHGIRLSDGPVAILAGTLCSRTCRLGPRRGADARPAAET